MRALLTLSIIFALDAQALIGRCERKFRMTVSSFETGQLKARNGCQKVIRFGYTTFSDGTAGIVTGCKDGSGIFKVIRFEDLDVWTSVKSATISAARSLEAAEDFICAHPT